MVSFTKHPVPPSQARRSSAIFGLRHNAFDKAASTLLVSPLMHHDPIYTSDIKMSAEPAELTSSLPADTSQSSTDPNTSTTGDESSLLSDSSPAVARRLSVGGAIKRTSLRLQRQRSGTTIAMHSESGDLILEVPVTDCRSTLTAEACDVAKAPVPVNRLQRQVCTPSLVNDYTHVIR
jgi:hypothetical protein